MSKLQKPSEQSFLPLLVAASLSGLPAFLPCVPGAHWSTAELPLPLSCNVKVAPDIPLCISVYMAFVVGIFKALIPGVFSLFYEGIFYLHLCF